MKTLSRRKAIEAIIAGSAGFSLVNSNSLETASANGMAESQTTAIQSSSSGVARVFRGSRKICRCFYAQYQLGRGKSPHGISAEIEFDLTKGWYFFPS
jgi:hypothetical protein